MAETIDSIRGAFIGTVMSSNETDRTIEAFIPKLMPMVKEGNPDITVNANAGNPTLSISNRRKVTMSSTFTCIARDFETPLPKEGSRVLIWFLDQNPKYPLWEKFNVNDDWEVIDKERYPHLARLSIGDKTIDINTDDDISIELPEGYSITMREEGKQKTFSIKYSDDIESRLSLLENAIGTPSISKKTIDKQSKAVTETVPASGIYKHLEYLENDSGILRTKDIGSRLPIYPPQEAGTFSLKVTVDDSGEFIYRWIKDQSE